jgi:hypothetical protein
LTQGQIVVRGASLIDERTRSFQSLVISGRGRFRLVHSGDVKIYENLDSLSVPRAFLVSQARVTADDATALAAMNDTTFDPASVVVLNGTQVQAGQNDTPRATYRADILSYEPEQVVIETEGDREGWLVLTDAWYPGWRATVDGAPADIARADVLFRAVPVPAGRHRVEFVYDPVLFQAGLVISLTVAAVCVALWLRPSSISFLASRTR